MGPWGPGDRLGHFNRSFRQVLRMLFTLPGLGHRGSFRQVLRELSEYITWGPGDQWVISTGHFDRYLDSCPLDLGSWHSFFYWGPYVVIALFGYVIQSLLELEAYSVKHIPALL